MESEPCCCELGLTSLGSSHDGFDPRWLTLDWPLHAALTVIGAPLFYGRLYAYFAPRGLAGIPYLGGAAVVGVAELLHLSLRKQHLFMGDGAARAAHLKDMDAKRS